MRGAGGTSVTRRARAARSSSDSSSCPGFSVRPPPYAFDMSGGRGNMPHVATCTHTSRATPLLAWGECYPTLCAAPHWQPAAPEGTVGRSWYLRLVAVSVAALLRRIILAIHCDDLHVLPPLRLLFGCERLCSSSSKTWLLSCHRILVNHSHFSTLKSECTLNTNCYV